MLEEASFYKPIRDLQVRSLVALAVRNSLLEDLHSTNPYTVQFGLDKPVLGENDIKQITSEAIHFLSDVDFCALSSELSQPNQNPYGALPNTYPLAWNALFHLSKCNTSLLQRYAPITGDFATLPELHADPSAPISNEYVEEIQSGIDPRINSPLQQILSYIASGQMFGFLTDSFKMISRNPDKLFYVIESVLRSGKAVITHNFYISNGFVARRKFLLKPAHGEREYMAKFSNTSGLTKKHREFLRAVMKSL